MFDEVLDALGDVQRRRLLLALAEANPQDDRPIEPEDVTFDEAELERLLVRLHHVHLPKLEAYGFISWNRETNEVTKGPEFDEIQPLLELLNDHLDELPDDYLSGEG